MTTAPAFLDHSITWPFFPVLTRIAMAIALGLLVGLEREHHQKTGVRTFALTALLGCLGGMMGAPFSAMVIGIFALAAVGMSYRQMIQQQRLGLTTSMALIIVGFAGVLFGQGHLFTPAVAGILTAALLAWKEPISRFVLGLSDEELRSAILLAILSFIVFPVLPDHPVDRWGLIQPRENWASVIIIAGLGFVNYILMKVFGARGMEITAFFGGLINSRKVIVELGMRFRQIGDSLLNSVRRGILLATGAMLIRNGLIVALLAPSAAARCAVPLVVMLMVNAVLWSRARRDDAQEGMGAPLVLESPFKLSAALKFGLVFLILNVAGALAERNFGTGSFYFVSVAGGLLSSASSIASAATLISHHELTVETGVNGVILSSLTSIVANIPLIRGLIKDPGFRRQICLALILIAAAGLAGMAAYAAVFTRLL